MVEIVLLERGVGHFERKFQRKAGSSTNEFWRQNNRVPVLSLGVVCMILVLRLAVLIQYRRVKHRHTDRQTHRHTMHDAITPAKLLRVGKNCTDSTVDNNHALHTHEALHGVTAIKFYMNFFVLALGALGFGGLGLQPL